MPDLPIIAPTLPEGFCPATWQELVNEAVGKAVAQFDGSGFTVIINQEAVPAVTDQDKLWRRPSEGNRGLYQFSGGAWVVIHPYPANGIAGLWVEATPAQVWAFDGGDGTDPSVNPPSANNGAMWILDPNYDGRSPMGVGNIPTATPAKVLAVGENYGVGSHTLDLTEIPSHSHVMTWDQQDTSGGDQPNTLYNGTDHGGISDAIIKDTSTVGGGLAHNNIHPVRGQYYIVRSARINYVGT